jgi:hypothetical protein
VRGCIFLLPHRLDRSTYLLLLGSGPMVALGQSATRALCVHGGQYRSTDEVVPLQDWGRLRNLVQLAYDSDDATRRILVVPVGSFASVDATVPNRRHPKLPEEERRKKHGTGTATAMQRSNCNDSLGGSNASLMYCSCVLPNSSHRYRDPSRATCDIINIIIPVRSAKPLIKGLYCKLFSDHDRW